MEAIALKGAGLQEGGEQKTKEECKVSAAPASETPARRVGDRRQGERRKPAAGKDSGSIRVGIDKVDALINMVGELVITQSMLSQISSDLAAGKTHTLENMLDGINSHIDAGESRLFLVGKYYDEFKISDGVAKFTKRQARLDNRRLDKGSHWPI